jgi:calcyclin binding protein
MVSIMEVEDEGLAASTTSPMIEVIGSTTTTPATTAATTDMEEVVTTTTTEAGEKVLEAWEERLLDAQEVLALASTTTTTTSSLLSSTDGSNTDLVLRPTTRMHLEALGKRLQKEAEALQRVATTKKSNPINGSTGHGNGTTTSTTTTAMSSSATMGIPLSSSVKYVPIDRFAFDAGGYNEPFVTLYIDLPNVGTVRDSVTCQFTKSSFDLIIGNLNNKSYRLYKDSLEKDIDPTKCKYVVKANKVLVKLAKIKTSEYGGLDYWTKLTDPKKGSKADGSSSSNSAQKKDDPSASIMDMMKQMYEDGNMKKMIGETMMKQRNGELNKDKPGMPDYGKGMDDMDDF